MTQEEVANATTDQLHDAFKVEQAKLREAAAASQGSQEQKDAAAASTLIGDEILRRKSPR